MLRIKLYFCKQFVQHFGLLYCGDNNDIHQPVQQLHGNSACQVHPKTFFNTCFVHSEKLNQANGTGVYAHNNLQPQSESVERAGTRHKANCRSDKQFDQSVFNGKFVHKCANHPRKSACKGNKPVVGTKWVYEVCKQVAQKSDGKSRKYSKIDSRQKSKHHSERNHFAEIGRQRNCEYVCHYGKRRQKRRESEFKCFVHKKTPFAFCKSSPRRCKTKTSNARQMKLCLNKATDRTAHRRTHEFFRSCLFLDMTLDASRQLCCVYYNSSTA